MLNRIWLSFIVAAFFATCYQAFFGANPGGFQDVMQAVSSMAGLSVEIAIGLIGVLAFWLGIFQVAEQSGLINKVSRILAPLLCRIMPDIPRNHPALGSITMNISANVLGLDNAATPFGIKAMQDMQTLAPRKDTLTDSQILFLVLNTSSVTLFPIAVFLYRAEQGAAQPTDVFIPILLATSASTLAGLIVTCLIQRINLLNRVILLYLAGVFAALGAVIVYFSHLAASALATQSAIVANFLLFTFIIVVLVSGWRKQLDTYELFVEGAKKGFEVAVSLIPFLLAMLVAIGMLRASGILDLVVDGIRQAVLLFGGDARFVDGLPTALMKPLSGSGARALMIETMQHHGADSFAGRLSSVLQGSTETTFYVLAVYLGAVGIKHSRYAVACCLVADVAGIIAAIGVSYWFFG
ncbi:spore maturation protein [Alteromonas pelagimontana]|uniref:Spore maturation protein n=1 Tax=Alteromonas pelagimontana TaxID=1858656 RepID=A0A6M4MJ25_9ALTE|nr:spore maturation protein [Alteromonas pelagimontana]QJR82600.1 spore maturation protein [Alteromonas pelagimontana]